jgi:lipopolysaccharide biosynthesis protein
MRKRSSGRPPHRPQTSGSRRSIHGPLGPRRVERKPDGGRQLDTLLVALAAVWRHPFRAKKRRAYRAGIANGNHPRRAANGDARSGQHNSRENVKPGETPDDDDARDVHALLYDTYVRNSLCAYPKDEFVDLQTYDATVSDPDGVKLVAYYLPQFHAIPENDRWWGPGFTEWRNVARAFPHFADPYQPRVPGELGYYDLRVVDVMRRQAELARNYGISAFCFHFYWFNSKTLLELPIKNFFDNKDIDIGFSLCWANENWSRRWDGSEQEILISQEHSPEDDVAFIRHIAKYFSDPRYLRVDGKPILTVYRPSILPNPGETVRRWREEVERLGFPGIYLIATNAFAFTDYKSFGFDALSEFPPHHVRAQNVREDFRLSRDFTGWRIRSYGEIVASELQRKPAEDSVIHPGVMPSWDNSPRRPHNGEIIHGSSPALFETWLTHAVDLAADNPARQRFVFINAWNEWAEGAYLEPDRRYGYAYLDKCRATLAAHAEAGAHANRIAGAIEPRADRSTVLGCAHWVGDEVVGGERSLIDVVR